MRKRDTSMGLIVDGDSVCLCFPGLFGLDPKGASLCAGQTPKDGCSAMVLMSLCK